MKAQWYVDIGHKRYWCRDRAHAETLALLIDYAYPRMACELSYGVQGLV